MFKQILLFLFVCFAALLSAEPTVFECSLSPAGKIQRPGITAVFRGKVIAGDELPGGCRVVCEELINGNTAHSKFIKFGEEVTISRKLTAPGWYAVNFRIVDKKGSTVQVVNKKTGRRVMLNGRGLMVAPEKIKAAKRPADFDAFWNSRRKLLNTVPVKELERKEIAVPKSMKGKVRAFDVKVACAGSKPVSGILSIPAGAKEKSLPAVVWFQGSGVRSADLKLEYAPHVILFNVNAHGIPNQKKEDFYKKLAQKELAGYMYQGLDTREKYYFYDMFLRVMRALDYVKKQPQWNGKMLVVRGKSQGGAQAIVAAALDPQVTLLIAAVPALADHLGPLAKPARKPGWPHLLEMRKKPESRRIAGYYDMINFASRIRCETHLTAGLIDRVCPPTGVYMIYNALPRKVKKSIFLHAGGHHLSAGVTAEMIKTIFDHFKEEEQIKQ